MTLTDRIRAAIEARKAGGKYGGPDISDLAESWGIPLEAPEGRT